MSECIEYSAFVFDLVITSAGDFPEGTFDQVILRYVDPEDLQFDPMMAMTVAGFMVRSGLRICADRDPGVYRQFLIAVLHYLFEETDRVVDDTMLDAHYVPGPAPGDDIDDMPFCEIANMLLDDGHEKEPRLVAWGLIRDGLNICHDYDYTNYPILLSGLRKMLLNEEMPRTENWPRRIIRQR